MSPFTPRVRGWFEAAFAEPTPVQAAAWPEIATGEHVLISAPTGSGKTLAAFLWALDRLAAAPSADGGRRTKVVYVSPMKALSYDIERNLRVPLQGIGADIEAALRTGDTPQSERRRMLKEPPDILITTPESLYLMLTGRARETLRGAEWVIVDEIHAVAASKRGAHLALTLERLDALVRETGRKEPQRIGLSATQTPLEEVARFLTGPSRPCRIVDASAKRPLDVKVHMPVDSAEESIWPAIWPELLKLIGEHNSTIVFVNNRRSAERVAQRLNELAEKEIARAHHGSLAREERVVVEELLKAGEIPCIVATSSLELGIDMGAVDLVVQVESPKSVAAGLQRIGRAGHSVGEVSKGRIFPKFRGDLLECAVLVKRMKEGAIEPTVVVRNPLDVLAQQIVATAAAEEEVAVEELYERARRTYSFADLPRRQFEGVLDMLDGRYPSSEFGELRPRIVWDRAGGTVRPRKGARALAVANAGTIPDRGLYLVVLPDGRRVGELDEEMVYEARPGQVFLLGASAWRIEEIGRDRVVVTPAPGAPGAVPFWKGDGVGRPKALGEAVGAFARWAVDQPAEALEREYDLDARAARNLGEYLREQQEATGVLPSDRTIVVERFRDEIGDWRLCVLSPYGARIHAAWGLALSAKIRARTGVEADVITSDDGIVLHLPEIDGPDGPDAPTGAEEAVVAEDELEDLVVGELGGSALFGGRFREAAGRALLIPRAWPGRRTPLWQQRLKAQTLLEVARRWGDFPIVLEAYRECLRDVLDIAGCRELLGRIARNEVSVVEVETAGASPFAGSLLFDYVAKYMYEGDAPAAERRAAALSLDKDLLRELLGQEELRELIDRGALERLEEDLQRRGENGKAANRDELHDTLRMLGDLSTQEAGERTIKDVDAGEMLAALGRERRAAPVRVGGVQRWIDAADAGLYRDAVGAVPPGGLPEAFLADVPDTLGQLLGRWAATRGPFTTEQARARWGLGAAVVEGALRGMEQAGTVVRGELHPDGAAGRREWCDAEVLRRLRRASLAALRREIEPAERRASAAFLPAWHGIDRHGPAGAGVERLRERLVPLQGLALTPRTWEREVLPRRVGAYSTAWMDELCASGELVWIGVRPPARAGGRSSGAEGRVALYFREDIALLGPPPRRGEELADSAAHARVRARVATGACFFTDLLADTGLDAPELSAALWDLVWAGEVTNDAFASLRAPRLRLAAGGAAGFGSGQGRRRGRFSGGRSAGRGGGRAVYPPGRWSPTAPLFAGGEASASDRLRATAELLLERHGILTRELVLAEGIQGGFAALYPELCRLETLGTARRGYFVEGLGGAQFALGGAVERLRAQRTDEPAGARGVGHPIAGAPKALVLAATDPAQPYGAALPWPRPEDGRGGQEHGGEAGPRAVKGGQEHRRQTEKTGAESPSAARSRPSPAPVPGAVVVLAGGEPVLCLERGGRALRMLVSPANPSIPQALEALAEQARADRLPARIALERVDGEPVLGSAWEAVLERAGFRAGPRRIEVALQ
jgi:ATP-dependent helicase Lhr and Lhr-like helicase